MANYAQKSVLRQIHAIYSVGTFAGRTDGQLLERFTARGGEAADLPFTALVQRHGPMVHRVRYRLLHDSRVARGRQRPHTRLVRRRIAPTAAIATVRSSTASAAVPQPLFDLVVKTAARAVFGRTAAGTVSATVSELVQGELKIMFMSKIKT